MMQYLMILVTSHIYYRLPIVYVKTCFLGELYMYYVTFALWHDPSVCVCRLHVTLLRPTQRVKIFSNIFAT